MNNRKRIKMEYQTIHLTKNFSQNNLLIQPCLVQLNYNYLPQIKNEKIE